MYEKNKYTVDGNNTVSTTFALDHAKLLSVFLNAHL